MSKRIFVSNTLIIGLNSSLLLYRLVFQLNASIKSKFVMTREKGDFQTYIWEDTANDIKWRLKANTRKVAVDNTGGNSLFVEESTLIEYLEPNFKNIDFFLLTTSDVETDEKMDMINQLRTMPNLTIIEQIKTNKLKNI